MVDIAEIMMRRSPPGILIFDQKGRLLFANHGSSELIAARPAIEEEVRGLCDRMRASPEGVSREEDAMVLSGPAGNGPVSQYAVRAFMVGEEGGATQGHIFVLLEKVVEKRSVDFEGAKVKFDLSKREVEVLRVIHEGLNNKEIADRLFISEQTVKDHTRSIMRKVGVNSRSSLIAALR